MSYATQQAARRNAVNAMAAKNEQDGRTIKIWDGERIEKVEMLGTYYSPSKGIRIVNVSNVCTLSADQIARSYGGKVYKAEDWKMKHHDYLLKE